MDDVTTIDAFSKLVKEAVYGDNGFLQRVKRFNYEVIVGDRLMMRFFCKIMLLFFSQAEVVSLQDEMFRNKKTCLTDEIRS